MPNTAFNTGVKNALTRARSELIIRDARGRIFAGQHVEGGLVFPGGGVEKGESPLAAARREALEEAGIRVRNVRPLTKPVLVRRNPELMRLLSKKDYGKFVSDKLHFYVGDYDKKDSSLFGSVGDVLRDAKFMTPKAVVTQLKREAAQNPVMADHTLARARVIEKML